MIRSIPRLVWVGLLFLGISTALMMLSKSSQVVNPSAASYDPSGLRAFADLLRSEGYSVRLDRTPIPNFEKGDVAIAVFLDKTSSWGGDAETPSNVARALGDHFNSGGSVILSTVPGDGLPGPKTFSTTVTSILGKPNREAVVTRTEGSGILDQWDECDVYIPSWKAGASTVAGLHLFEDGGTLHEVADATGATNRFIDRQDNAAFWLDIVRAVSEPTSTIVFVEAASGNADAKGLLGALGEWASLAWAQVLILLLVVGYTLGKPFGLPERGRTTQRGGRDLADALAAILGRSRRYDIAMQALQRQAVHRTRHRPPDDPVPELIEDASKKEAMAYVKRLAAWEAGEPVDD